MGGYYVNPSSTGDTTPLPLFNVHWISTYDEDGKDSLDLVVAAPDKESAIALGRAYFPNYEAEHWGSDPVRFDKGVYVL